MAKSARAKGMPRSFSSMNADGGGSLPVVVKTAGAKSGNNATLRIPNKENNQVVAKGSMPVISKGGFPSGSGKKAFGGARKKP
jgi:hypothetical protein